MEEIQKVRKKVAQSRKNELRVRILKYAVMSVGALILLTVALFYVLAYRFDVKNVEVRQTGLVKFASSPNGARIYIDGELKNIRTASEQVLDIGEHSVRYEMDGYRSWEKTFALSHGQVLWLDYVLMLPDALQFDTVAEISGGVKDIVVTRDGRRALVQYASSARFALVTMSDPTKVNVEEFMLSGGAVSTSDGEEEFEIIGDDSWSKRFLIQHRFAVDGEQRHEYIVVNRDDLVSPKNLTNDLVIDVKEVAFSEDKEDQFYVIDTSDDLRLVDHGAKSISAPIVRGAILFSQYRDKMAVASNNSKGEVTFGALRSGRDYKAVKNFLAADGELGDIDVNFNSYFNKDYMVILARNQVNIISEPFSNVYETIELFNGGEDILSANNFKWTTVSENGQVILVGDDEFTYYYNMETKEEIYRAFIHDSLLGQMDEGGETSASARHATRPKFIDKFKVLAGSKLLDVDGSNAYELEEPVGKVFLSGDKRYMFGLLDRGDSHATFVRARIIL